MAIDFRHVYKSFGEKDVLRDLSWKIEEGTCHILMGPSGSGKTTILRLLLGLETPSSGEISGLPKRSSAVFQEDRLLPGLSAEENIRAVLGRKVRREEIRENLSAVGLSPERRVPAGAFSGGMKRRLAIVRACMAGGSLIVLDEPFQGLDEENKAKAAAYIAQKRQGRTLVMATHDEADARLLGIPYEKLTM